MKKLAISLLSVLAVSGCASTGTTNQAVQQKLYEPKDMNMQCDRTGDGEKYLVKEKMLVPKNLHKQPTVLIRAGATVQVHCENGEWFGGTYANGHIWVPKDNVKAFIPALSPAELSDVCFDNNGEKAWGDYHIKASSLNVRNKPDAKSGQIVDNLPEGWRVELKCANRKWSLIEYVRADSVEKSSGWVVNRFLAKGVKKVYKSTPVIKPLSCYNPRGRLISHSNHTYGTIKHYKTGNTYLYCSWNKRGLLTYQNITTY